MKTFLQRLSAFFLANERFVFFLFALGFLLPWWMLHYVGSLDGPKHLAAASIIDQLLIGNESFAHYFTFNPPFIGNVLGIYILSFFKLLLPAWLAEKLFLTLYVFSFAYGFRYLVKAISGKTTGLSVLIFPFAFTSLMMMGYYNFSFAIGILFFTLGYWINNYQKFNHKSLFWLSLWLLLTYFSHLFVFYMLLLVMALVGLTTFFREVIKQPKMALKSFLSLTFQSFLVAMPALLLSGFYLKRIFDFQQSPGLKAGTSDKLTDLMNFRMLVGYDLNLEIPFTKALFVFFVILCLAVFLYRFIVFFKNKGDSAKCFFTSNDVWLFIALVFLLLYFVLPDGADAAASVGIRMLVLTAIFFALWLSVLRLPSYFSWAAWIAILIFGFQSRAIHLKYLRPLDETIRQIVAVDQQIPPNSRVVALNFSKNWLMNYFHHYVAVNEPLVDLRNNACSPFMAIDWKNGKPEILADSANATGFTGNLTLDGRFEEASHVVIFEYRWYLKEETLPRVRQRLDRFYDLKYASENGVIAVFEKKSTNILSHE